MEDCLDQSEQAFIHVWSLLRKSELKRWRYSLNNIFEKKLDYNLLSPFALMEINSRRPPELSMQIPNVHNIHLTILSMHWPSKLFLVCEAFGCPPIRPAWNAWAKTVTGQYAVVQCNNSSEAWYLICRGTEWVGQIGNCSTASPIQSTSE